MGERSVRMAAASQILKAAHAGAEKMFYVAGSHVFSDTHGLGYLRVSRPEPSFEG